MYRAHSSLPLSRRPAFRRASRKNLISLGLCALSRSVAWWRWVRARMSVALCLGVLTEKESERNVLRRIFVDAVNEHVYFLLLLSPLRRTADSAGSLQSARFSPSDCILSLFCGEKKHMPSSTLSSSLALSLSTKYPCSAQALFSALYIEI